jgi:hypothetical protein
MFIFYEFRPFCIHNARVIYRKIFQCIPRMFIFYEFRPFCIDNARVIYRKIRALQVQQTLKHALETSSQLLVSGNFLQKLLKLVVN